MPEIMRKENCGTYDIIVLALPQTINGLITELGNRPTILINGTLPENVQAAALRHELVHLRGNHLHRDDLTIDEKEAAARAAE